MTKKEKTKKTEKKPEQKEEKIISPAELLNEQLIAKTKEAADFKDKYFRALAETENAKKRLMQEKKDLVAYSVSNIIEDILNPMDNLENALKFTDNLSDEMKNWALGFKMILDQFNAALENHGIVSYESVNKAFDPHYHEAVEMIESEDHTPGTIVEELMKGYRHDKRIIRAAKVKVSKETTKEENK